MPCELGGELKILGNLGIPDRVDRRPRSFSSSVQTSEYPVPLMGNTECCPVWRIILLYTSENFQLFPSKPKVVSFCNFFKTFFVKFLVNFWFCGWIYKLVVAKAAAEDNPL
jgi:hypothetical protein